ncbi:cell division protein ZipA C-terminal FtsZ-binding domain-containing protein [Thiomicrospira pelophila]|uniref:cell division protein ZipA C-terminal FtsZ-binding domain-containing protein n=1 Tax=Thiomicrospira pelophila TaxID=934 RepID=UPI0004A77721|nr:cell division protein ZipA C-terminal FtsZ-binding domain-containing protein [Thiomicrospira pelophila]
MNELQQVLLVFAVIVVVGLYLFSRQRNQESGQDQDSSQDQADSNISSSNDPLETVDLPDQPNSHPTQTTSTSPRADAVAGFEPEDYVPEAQAKLPFGEDFELTPPNIEPEVETDDTQPEELELTQPGSLTPRPPQVFAILVLSSHQEFSLNQVSQTLRSIGLSFSDKGTFVKKTNQKITLQVANIMEPGLFPAEPVEGLTTPGVALITELPCAVVGSKAIDDLIMTARRISQRLNGRMYDMQRHLLRESDLQAMREAASEFEATKT